ncbi:MAG TPA: hypothetical protein VLC10_00640 [Patescibacteria group bacterium]|nr:hypothetical protein [Patescibacteria group bacterium]
MDPLAMLDLLPRITRFLEEPSGSCFLVPSAYAGPVTGNLKAAGFATKTVSCAAASHSLEAVAIPLKGGDPKERLGFALTEMFGSPDVADLEVVLCVAGRRAARFLPLVVPKDAKVEIHDKREPLETDRDVKLRNLAFGEYRKALVMLARLSGLAVHFHAEGGGIRPPFPHEPGVVRILTNACPPGHTTARYVPLAFGLKINEDGLSALANGPTKGRGIVLKDELGEPMVQILGNTWYLLIPTLSNYNFQTSALIFGKLLALAWKGAREAAKAAGPKRMTRKAFTETVSLWTDELPALIREDVKNMDRKIQDAQRDLADLTRRKKESLALLEAFDRSSFAREAKARCAKDFLSIKADPRVAGITFIDDGFHVETRPLEASHRGAKYALGAFVIRVGKRGTVSVWSEAPTHKDGIPHPHIAKEGGPCFGNATDAIAKAGGEQRYADAVRYVLRWLTEGYTHALAAVKIEEWPYVGETPDHYETRWLADKALAQADADAGIRLHPVASALVGAVHKAVVDLAQDAPADERTEEQEEPHADA